jgi:hypothetical protein
VRILRRADEVEVVAAFLAAELDSSRYGDRLRSFLARDGMDVRVLSAPATADERENEYRRGLLDEHRGWVRREGLFTDFPEQVEWWRAALVPEEVLAILYIAWDWWLTLSGGSRRPVDAAQRIRGGEVAGVTVMEHEPIALALRASAPPPELIVLTGPRGSRLVLVEGHVRLTAYALFPDFLPPELVVFLGIAEDAEGWWAF